MFADKRFSRIIIAAILMATIACTATNRLLKYEGVRGESRSDQHTRWVDDLGRDAGISVDETNPDPDPLQGESAGADAADTSAGSMTGENLGDHPSLQNTEIVRQVSNGDITIDLIESKGGGTQGHLLEVVITNQSGEEISVEIPPGLTFTPEDEGEQDLMVLDAVVVELDPGETVVLEPYVICIESSDSAPTENSRYIIGRVETGDLANFADCVDSQQDGTLTEYDIGLQYTVWSIADGGFSLDLTELSEDPTGALADLINQLESTGMLETMQTLSQSFTQEWLDRCDITLEE